MLSPLRAVPHPNQSVATPDEGVGTPDSVSRFLALDSPEPLQGPPAASTPTTSNLLDGLDMDKESDHCEGATHSSNSNQCHAGGEPPIAKVTRVRSTGSHSTYSGLYSGGSYEMEDGLIVLQDDHVTAPMRVKIFTSLYGATRPDGIAWKRDDVAKKFKDLVGQGTKCLNHNLEIKSGSSWHCKGDQNDVCAPCKVLKVKKQIGICLPIGHTGGIPRMILDLAILLQLHNSVDYRDLRLIFQALTALGDDMTSCDALWTVCSQDANGKYLVANKRFFGCLMAVGHRPLSDSIEHSSSKGLANLWDENKIWNEGKYLVFTQTTRYMPHVNKMKERSIYKANVIDASVAHVKKIRVDWQELSEACWQELQSAFYRRKKSFKKRKKTMGEEAEEEEEEELRKKGYEQELNLVSALTKAR